MSQITRCPACGTTFKVVADQLRISDGWVRCGQCKEVFDAAAHLVRSASQDLLPEMAIPEGPRPAMRPPAPAVRAWGGGNAGVPKAASSSTLAGPPAPGPAPALVPAPSQPAQPSPQAFPESQANPLSLDDTLPAPLQVPEAPPVPSYLTARPLASPGVEPPADWRLEPASPLVWRTRSSATDSPAGLSKPAPPPSGWELPGPASIAERPAPAVTPAPASTKDDEAKAANGIPPPEPMGYELPFAELRDSEWPDDLEDGPQQAATSDAPDGHVRQPSTDDAIAKAVAMDMALEAIEADTDPVAIATQAGGGLEGWAPLPAGAAAASAAAMAGVQRPVQGLPAHVHAEDDDEEEGMHATAADEPGFMRAARRKAFWRKPAVRAGMALMLLALAAGLALQMAVQERDRLASQYPDARPALQALCVPLQCTIAAPRRIADVVIDSSSFNKGRGDSYQLGLSIKSRAGFAVAMPSVELTLTDTQDRPVLRRVLQPQDLGAPVEIAPGGEWSGTLPVVVVTGGARVSGYRVIAFYP
ncbi:DUF3426 domain-containing protein [Acidovorax sp. NCPPB 3576]|uniref:DUF3426 domain-containing protein n=1 Tax=Acidovorax sp. NCPPB 3576 TaxID=2940488 RepID=UPI00234AE35A|nr:DUF3426 domain-containing protein [Acidovorax sp. NCPPB 3576]WCM87581.1 DUF3426 domain-containing protein [Acidovorax sp. NCPPB 3576]